MSQRTWTFKNKSQFPSSSPPRAPKFSHAFPCQFWDSSNMLRNERDKHQIASVITCTECSRQKTMNLQKRASLLVRICGVCAMFALYEGAKDQVNTHHCLLDLVVNCNSARPWRTANKRNKILNVRIKSTWKANRACWNHPEAPWLPAVISVQTKHKNTTSVTVKTEGSMNNSKFPVP